MWAQIKKCVVSVGTILVGFILFMLGGRLNQAKHDKNNLTQLKNQLQKNKEVDDEANKKKNSANPKNSTNKLNSFFK
jgi:sortase (surface protein transpeptidase)